MSILKKVVIVIMVLLLVITCIPINVKALNVDESLGNLDNYGKVAGKSDEFLRMVGVILGVVQVVGSLMSIICLIVLGIKYMLGSVEEKAQYKKTLWPYLLGAIMVFGISNILNIIYIVGTNIA